MLLKETFEASELVEIGQSLVNLEPEYEKAEYDEKEAKHRGGCRCCKLC